MAKINRSDVIQKAVNDLAISTSTDKIPNETLDKVQLTYDLNNKFSQFVVGVTGNATGTLTTNLPNVSSSGETYITALQLSLIKDVVCDQAQGLISLSLTLDKTNLSTIILSIPVLTLTAQSENVFLSLPYPIKVKNNSAITCAASFTAGLLTRNVRVMGFVTSSN
jgi:hypothetical protein